MPREFALVLSVAASFCGEAKPVAVTPCEGYNSWPMIQAVGGKLVCAYSRGSGHTIGEGRRGVYAKTSSDFVGTDPSGFEDNNYLLYNVYNIFYFRGVWKCDKISSAP